MFSNLPPVTKALLIANAAVFVLQLLLGDFALAAFMLWRWPNLSRPTARTSTRPLTTIW